MALTTALGYTPAFSISKGSDNLDDAFKDRFLSLKIESRDGKGDSDTVDLTIDDRDWNVVLPSIGDGSATLSISLGYEESSLWDMGTFQIDELHPEWTPKQLRLHGNSTGFTSALKAPLITHFDGKSLGDIVGAIAATAGVTPVVSAALANIQIPYLNQASSSGHLLQELERNFDGVAKFDNGYLTFTPRGSGQTVSGQSSGTFTLTPEDFGPGNSLCLTNGFAYSKVRAGYRDPTTNVLTWLESSVPGNPNGTVPFLIKRAFNSQAEAQAGANAQMSRLNRYSVQGTIVLAKGAPQIRGEQKFTIEGCRPGIDGSYVVSVATHTLTKAAGLGTTLQIYSDDGDASEGGE